jgi:hypothetical protein
MKNKDRKKQMKFTKKAKVEQEVINSKDYIIDIEKVSKIRLAVYHNEANYTAEVDFHFDEIQPVFNTDYIKLRQNYSKYDNVRTRIPQGFEIYDDWYKVVREEARAWAKHHGANLHAKLGCRLTNRYHTIPFNWSCYSPTDQKILLIIGEYNNITHIEVDLDRATSTANGDLHYTYIYPE